MANPRTPIKPTDPDTNINNSWKDSGCHEPGHPPCIVGREFSAQTGGESKSAGKGAKKSKGSMELNLVASYKKPNQWNNPIAERKSLAKWWSPHTEDFKKVLGKSSIEVKNPKDFLLKIIKAKKPISRLNFMTHGSRTMVSISGTIKPPEKKVDFDTVWSETTYKKTDIVQPYSNEDYFGDEYDEIHSDRNIHVGNESFSLDDVRAKFTDNAVMWIYSCNGAASTLLIRQIANTFHVKVCSFRYEIVYCAPPTFPADRKHKVTSKENPDTTPNCVNQKYYKTNFRDVTENKRCFSPKLK